MFLASSKLNLLQEPSARFMAFQLWGHFMFPRSTPPTGEQVHLLTSPSLLFMVAEAFIPAAIAGLNELTMIINNESAYEPKRKMKLKPVDTPGG